MRASRCSADTRRYDELSPRLAQQSWSKPLNDDNAPSEGAPLYKQIYDYRRPCPQGRRFASWTVLSGSIALAADGLVLFILSPSLAAPSLLLLLQLRFFPLPLPYLFTYPCSHFTVIALVLLCLWFPFPPNSHPPLLFLVVLSILAFLDAKHVWMMVVVWLMWLALGVCEEVLKCGIMRGWRGLKVFRLALSVM